MKLSLSKLFLLVGLLCSTAKLQAQLPSAPATATNNVAEASQYGVLYELNLPVSANYSSLASILYSVNNSGLSLNYSRIAYFVQLDSKWVWVSMNKFNTTNAQLSVPYASSGIIFQQQVTGMNVSSSSGSGVTSATNINGNIEIWPDCYDMPAALGGIGGNGSNYDFNDTRQANSNCYGSFQVHNFGASQTIFAINNFMGGPLDLGIGNNTGNSHPDWTFMANAASYTTTRKLYILVQRGTTIVTQPSSTAKNACLNGTTTALTVSTAVNSGTITNYQWFSVATATNTGGTLVATHTTTLTTDSYVPATTAVGTLYYYCVVNSSGSNVTTSSASGAQTVLNPTISITGASAICAGSSISLNATSSSAFTSYVWSNSASSSGISVSPSSTTSYSVSATTSIGCVAASSPVTVTVNSIPVISVPNGTICNGSSFVLSPTGASTYTYSGGTATVSPSATSNYTVSGTSSDGCIGTNTGVNVLVNSLPIISITGTNAICVGESAVLTATGADTFTWNTSSNSSAISVSPANTTGYSVSGTSSEGCVSASAANASVTVYNLPVISITGTNAVCEGSSVSLTAGGADTYTWSTSANTSVVNLSPTTTSSYSVSGTSINGCVSSSSAVATVSVNSLPVVSITGTAAICEGGSSILSLSGASTYTWDSSSNASSLSVSPASTTSYSVNGTSADGCVSALPAVITVTVYTSPLVTITGTTELCNGNSATLNANGASTYTWNTSANTTAISVSPSSTTSYSLTGTSSEGCASASPAVATVTVYNLPTISITGANTVCAGSSLALSAGGASTYTWNSGSTLSTVNVTPSTTSNYSVSGTDANGCLSSVSAVTSVSVISLPVLSIAGATAICEGASTTLSVTGASSYTWDSGSNALSILVSPTSSGTYAVLGSSAEGCISASSAIFSLLVNQLPVVSITGTNAICAGGSASLTANGASTFTWNTSSTASGISVNPSSTSTYSVSGTSSAGCISALSGVHTVSVYTLPSISITGANTVCAGNSVALSAAGANTYSWNTGSTSSVLTISPSSTNSYSVSGTSADGCVSSSSAVASVSVYSLPTLNISGSNTLCAGASVNLTSTGAQTYTWNTGSNATSISVSPSSTTIYSVVGTSSLGCLSSSAALQTVTVHALPSLSITGGPQSICVGQSTSITANGAQTYTWSGLGNSATVAVSPTVTTTYTLTGTSSQGCLGSQALRTITVNALPNVTSTGTTGICNGGTTSLTAGGASTYSWIGVSASTVITVSPSVTTTYTLIGTSSAGCNQTTLHTVTVNALPTLTVSGTTGICTGQTASLNVSGAATYSWNTGATSNAIVTTPSANTIYTVTGVSTLGCVKTTTQLVTVAASLSVSITGPSAICEGDAVNLTASGGATYTWNTSESSQVISSSPSVTTTYSVIGASGTCSNTAFATVVVYSNPTLNVSGNTAICFGDSTILTVTGADAYVWSNSNLSNSIVVTPSATTVYSVVGQYTTGCFSGAATTITVNALPVITVAGDSTLCFGNTAILTATGATNYTWTTNATTASISVSPTTNTSYSVIGTDANGCINGSSIMTLTVNPVPTLNVSSSSSAICKGDSITLTVSGADTYLWDDNSTTATVIFTPAVSTNYSVTGTNTFACSSSSQIAITVNALPNIAISGPSVICVNETGNLVASGASSYTWSSGQTSASLAISPSLTTTYSISGTSNEGCVGMSNVQVEVSTCTGLRSNGISTHVSLYPNPTKGIVYISVDDESDVLITVRNVLGQVLMTEKVNQTTTLQLQDYNKGLYYISLTKNNEVLYNSTIVKE